MQVRHRQILKPPESHAPLAYRAVSARVHKTRTPDEGPLFPTLAVGLLDFKVDVVLARLEADFRGQPPSIPAVPNRRVSLPCPTIKYPCSAQPQSIPAVPNRRVSLQCPTIKYPCSAQPMSIPAMLNGCAQPQSIPAVPNRRVSLQCPTAKYPCSAQLPSIPGVPNSRVSIFLQRVCSAARKTVEGGGRETLHFLCRNGFRVGMLEVNNLLQKLARPHDSCS